MSKDYLQELIETGREIEFDYRGKRYSVTYMLIDDKEYISFCEFYKETTEVATFDELCQVERNGVSVIKMWESITEEDIWVF